jgi:spore coat polysaccharide biosynthesis protein SpsF
MKTVATIEARMLSTRLPGKVLMEVCGQPMLARMVERVRRARSLDDIVIATSEHPSCDPIASLALEIGVRCFRGSEEDVLDRVLKAAASVAADTIVELTGDCPLIDPAVIDRIVTIYGESGVDYCANVLQRTYPAGMDTQVFSFGTLDTVSRLTCDPADREHVSLYIYKHPERFSLKNVESSLPSEMARWRLVVDHPQDLILIRKIYEDLYPRKADFLLDDIRRLLERHPEWLEINRRFAK